MIECSLLNFEILTQVQPERSNDPPNAINDEKHARNNMTTEISHVTVGSVLKEIIMLKYFHAAAPLSIVGGQDCACAKKFSIILIRIINN